MERTSSLFAYGTLMCPEIMAEVCGCRVAGRPATLRGYRRLAVRDEEYPGLVEEEGAELEGVLYRWLPQSVWPRLDRFEGEEYQRKVVEVEPFEGRPASAFVYVTSPLFRHRLSDEPWDFDHFMKEGRGRFLSDYPGLDDLGW